MTSLTNPPDDDAFDLDPFGAWCMEHGAQTPSCPADKRRAPVDVTSELQSAAGALSDALSAIDDALRKIDEALNRAQPPVSGRLRIHFLKGAGTWPAPALVQWRLSKKKKWWPTKVPWKSAGARAKFGGAFELNYQQARALLAEAAHLVGLRQEMLAKRRSMLLSLRFGTDRLLRAAEVAQDRAAEWHAECEENLALKRG